MIRKTAHGFYVIEGDTHISKWAEESGRLDHDQWLLPQILPLIPEGGTVVDVGAFIGDHTIAYARKVGRAGYVMAFEPNPIANECLRLNLIGHPVEVHETPLSDKRQILELVPDQNAGASFYVAAPEGTKMSQSIGGEISARLDDVFMMAELDFIKIDAEGFELKILKGGANTLHKYRPKMLIEINGHRLFENGTHVHEILAFLKETIGDFEHKLLPEESNYASPQYDLLIIPR